MKTIKVCALAENSCVFYPRKEDLCVCIIEGALGVDARLV